MLCLLPYQSYSLNTDSLDQYFNTFERAARLDKYFDFFQDNIYNNTTLSLKYSLIGMKYAEEIAHQEGIMKMSFYVAMSYDLLNNLENAVRYYNKSLELATELQDNKGLTVCHNNLGIIYKNKGEYSKAIDHFMQSLQIAEANNIPESKISAYINVANVLVNWRKYDEGIGYLEKALSIARESGDTLRTGIVYINLGNAYKDLNNDVKKATRLFEKALELFKAIDYQSGVLGVLRMMTNVYFESDSPEIDAAYKEAYTLAEKLDDIKSLSLLSMQKAKYLIKKKRYQQAKNILLEDIPRTKKLGLLHHESEQYQLLSVISEESGNLADALAYHKKHKMLNDSVFNKQNTDKVTEMQVTLETEEKAREIEKLKSESNIQMLKTESAEKTRNYILAITVLLILFAAFILNRWLYSKKINKMLQQSEAVLREINNTKDRFFSIVAHDLKNPLSSFMNITSTLSENYDEFSEEDKMEIIETIKESSLHLYSLLENLLTWSRSQRGAINYSPESVSLAFAVKNVYNTLELTANAKNIELISHIPETVSVYADAQMLITIIRNLVSNAIKYSPEGGKIETLTDIEIKNGKEYRKITVADSGIGMDDDILNSLFKLERQSSMPGTNNEKGTGLGLIICKEFIEKHSGFIEAESQPQAGTKFNIYIP